MKSIFEYVNRKPVRRRADIYIIKDDNIIFGIPDKGYTTYIVPGGKIEGDESPEKTAQREAIEELGISTKDLTFLSKKLIKYSGTSSNQFIQKNIDKYSGVEIYTFVGYFDKQIKIDTKSNNDTYKTIELSKDQALQHFKTQLQKEKEDFNKKKIIYVIECLKKI